MTRSKPVLKSTSKPVAQPVAQSTKPVALNTEEDEYLGAKMSVDAFLSQQGYRTKEFLNAPGTRKFLASIGVNPPVSQIAYCHLDVEHWQALLRWLKDEGDDF